MNAKQKEEIKRIIDASLADWEIIKSGILLIKDSGNYKKKSTHGLSNQEYDKEMEDVVYRLFELQLKQKVYEHVLANTPKSRLLIKANELHKAVLEYRKEI